MRKKTDEYHIWNFLLTIIDVFSYTIEIISNTVNDFSIILGKGVDENWFLFKKQSIYLFRFLKSCVYKTNDPHFSVFTLRLLDSIFPFSVGKLEIVLLKNDTILSKIGLMGARHISSLSHYNTRSVMWRVGARAGGDIK